MGGFLKSAAKQGATGAATAFGGPAAGLAAGAGMGALEGLLGGGNFYDMLGGGLQGGLNQYLTSLGGTNPGVPPTAPIPTESKSLFDVLNIGPKKNPLNAGLLDDYFKLNI